MRNPDDDCNFYPCPELDCCTNEQNRINVLSHDNDNGVGVEYGRPSANANSFAYEGELCAVIQLEVHFIHLYIRTISDNPFPIGKIDTLGGLDSDLVSFKVTQNSNNPQFSDDLVGKCLLGTIDSKETVNYKFAQMQK